VHFGGFLAGDEVLISGARSRGNLWQLYDEMVGISNEQVNLVRNLSKELVLRTSEPPGALPLAPQHDDAIYDEISRLNNELVNLQRELAKKTAELERLNAQKNLFLGMAAHDLRNPLNAILSYSEFLLDSAIPRLAAEEQEHLGLIHSLAGLMRDVVGDLLDVATIESGKLPLNLRATNLLSVLQHTIAVFRPLAERKQIRLILAAGYAPPLLMLDRQKVEQVLNNLLSNAIKYSHPQTVITLAVEQQGPEVIVAVQDQGQGIPADELAGLFQPFATTSVKATGGEQSTGLGLLIVKKVVEEHRGRIWVESRAGEGSTFTFALPIIPAEAPQALPYAPPHVSPGAPQPPGATAPGATAPRALRILLADDSLANQRLMRKILQRLGYEADVVASGAAVVAAVVAAASARPYDLLLVDIHMPEMDGLEATRRVRAELPPAQQPAIIALTASNSTELRDRCLAAGMNGWIEKPTLSSSENLRQLLAACVPLGIGR
jgi:signal transduction histidine kinase/CheY-like chemotaxis protein